MYRACELYKSHYYVEYWPAKLVMIVSALEVVAPDGGGPGEEASELLEFLITAAETARDDGNGGADVSAIIQGLHRLRQPSIGWRVSALVREILGEEEVSGIKAAYGLRSRILHAGHTDIKDLKLRVLDAARLVAKVLQVLLKRQFQAT